MTSHATAQRRVSGASTGWTGQSAQALAAFSAHFESVSTAVTDRIDHHSGHMHTAVQEYTRSEEQRARDLAGIDPAGSR